MTQGVGTDAFLGALSLCPKCARATHSSQLKPRIEGFSRPYRLINPLRINCPCSGVKNSRPRASLRKTWGSPPARMIPAREWVEWRSKGSTR